MFRKIETFDKMSKTILEEISFKSIISSRMDGEIGFETLYFILKF